MDETSNGTEDIWWILEGQDYPRLWWEAEGNWLLTIDYWLLLGFPLLPNLLVGQAATLPNQEAFTPYAVLSTPYE